MPADDSDRPDEEGRARLHAALDRSAAQFQADQGVPAEEALRQIREALRD